MVMVAILEGKIVLSQWRLPFNVAAITMEKVNNARPLLLIKGEPQLKYPMPVTFSLALQIVREGHLVSAL